jgi:hypothetical protein
MTEIVHNIVPCSLCAPLIPKLPYLVTRGICSVLAIVNFLDMQ